MNLPMKQPPQVPKFSEQQKAKQYSTIDSIKRHQPHLLEQHQNALVKFDQMEIEQEQQQKMYQGLFSPTLQLSGHQGEVYCCKFSPDGDYLLTAGFDKKILIWDIYKNCTNIGVVGEHQNAILDLHWSNDGLRLFTASADKTAIVWDMETFQPIKKFKGHTSYVNSCNPSRRGNNSAELLVTGGDDGVTKLWDLRTKKHQQEFEGKYPITCVTFSDQSDKIYNGSIDNSIKCYDLRKKELEYYLSQHGDTITGLSLSPDGSYLLSNAMDMTVRVFDVRSYVTGRNRQVRIFTGATQNASEKNLLRCAWSADGQQVSSGSADRYVYIWDYNSKKLLHRLAGHIGTINETAFSPKDRIIASASSDKSVIVGEIPEVSL